METRTKLYSTQSMRVISMIGEDEDGSIAHIEICTRDGWVTVAAVDMGEVKTVLRSLGNASQDLLAKMG